MGKLVNTFSICQNNEALSLQNEMEENRKGLPRSTQSPSTSTSKLPNKGALNHEAPTIHTSDTLDHGMIDLPSTKKDSLSELWKGSLIATVLGRKVKLQFCQLYLHRIWSLEGTVDIFDIGSGYFLLKFSLLKDSHKVLNGGAWLIQGHYIFLRPWVPNFKPSEATITHVKVWVRLPELPIEYYDKEVLLQIGAAIGRTIKIDPITEKQAICRFARICIEVDLKRPLLRQINIDELLQEIEYEGSVELLQQNHYLSSGVTVDSTPSQSSSHTKCAHPNPPEAPNASPNMASNDRNTPIGATQLQIPCWQSTFPWRTGVSGSQEKAATRIGLKSSGSRFSVLDLENNLDPAAEPTPSRGKSDYTSMSTSLTHTGENTGSNNRFVQKQSDYTSMSTSLTHTGKNTGSNNGLVQKQCSNAGEGQSSLAATTFVSAKDVPIAAAKMLTPIETLTSNVGASRLCNPMSSNLSQDMSKQLQTPHSSSSLLSSPLSSSKAIASPFSKDLQPTQDNQVHLPLPASFYTPSSEPTLLSLNQPQLSERSAIPQPSPMSDASIRLYSEAMQRLMKQKKIISKPESVQVFQELSTERSPTLFSIDSAISEIEIGVRISLLSNVNRNSHSISFKPTKTHHSMLPSLEGGHGGTFQNISKANPESHPKKLLHWNCHGAGDLKFMRAIKDLIQLHRPSIVVLETKISGGYADKLIEEIGFRGQYRIHPDEGFANGIWILWNTGDVHIEVASSTPQHIGFSVQVLSEAFRSMLRSTVAGNLEQISQPWGPSFFSTTEKLMNPAASEWVPFSKQVEVGQISSWA